MWKDNAIHRNENEYVRVRVRVHCTCHCPHPPPSHSLHSFSLSISSSSVLSFVCSSIWLRSEVHFSHFERLNGAYQCKQLFKGHIRYVHCAVCICACECFLIGNLQKIEWKRCGECKWWECKMQANDGAAGLHGQNEIERELKNEMEKSKSKSESKSK